MKKRTNKVTMFLAAVSVVLCVAVMGSGMALAQGSAENIVETLASETPTAPVQQAERKMIVVTEPFSIPKEAISPQLAVSIGEEVVEKAFRKTLETRFFVCYDVDFGRDRQLWTVQAETADGGVYYEIDALSGEFVFCRDESSKFEKDWSWFDSTTQEAENAQRAKNEDLLGCIERWQNKEDLNDGLEVDPVKLDDIKSDIEKYRDSALVTAAIAWVNERSTILFDGAKAIRAAVFLSNDWYDGNEEVEKIDAAKGEDTAIVTLVPDVILEVQLDNGAYVNLHMRKKDNRITFFQPLGTTSLTEYWYGVKIDW